MTTEWGSAASPPGVRESQIVMNSGEQVNAFRKTAVVVAGAALLAGAGTLAAQAQSNSSAETPWCTGSDLVISAGRSHSPSEGSIAHRITLAAAEGASCKIGGNLINVRFLDEAGNDLNVPLTGFPHTHEDAVLVEGHREAAVYMSSQLHGPRVFPASVRFNLPNNSGNLGESVAVAWPAETGIGAMLKMGYLMSPVS